MILLDTNFLFALKAKRDKKHDRAHEILEALNEDEKVVKATTYSVLNEVFTLAVARFRGSIHHLNPYFDLFWGKENFFKILLLERNEYREVYQVLKKYCTPKRPLSFIDASLIHLYEKHEAKQLISFDDHFDNILERWH